MEDEEQLKRYNRLYLEIINRYRDTIEQSEHMHVAELPKLVQPEDDTVKALARSIEARIPSYSYDDGFPDAARLAFEHVRNSVSTISLPVQFWLRPAQTIGCSAGDVFDKAVLLCSVLIAMGALSAKVAVTADGEKRRTIVYAEHKGKLIVMEMEGDAKVYASKAALIKALVADSSDDLTAYEFNDKMYADLA